MLHQAGGHFLQVPGPNKIPDRVLGVIAALCGPDFASPASKAVELLEAASKTTDLIVIQPSSGPYACGAAPTSARHPSNGIPTFVSKHIAPRSQRTAELMPAGAHLGIETGLAVAGILRRPSDIQSARETLSRPDWRQRRNDAIRCVLGNGFYRGGGHLRIS